MLDKQVIMLYIYNLNNVKKNLQILEEGLYFQASKEEIIYIFPCQKYMWMLCKMLVINFYYNLWNLMIF